MFDNFNRRKGYIASNRNRSMIRPLWLHCLRLHIPLFVRYILSRAFGLGYSQPPELPAFGILSKFP